MLTAFHPLPPQKAIQLVDQAGVADAEMLIRDYAAAGIVKSYALVIETIDVDDGRSYLRDAAVPAHLWHRMIEEGVVDRIGRGHPINRLDELLPWKWSEIRPTVGCS